MREVFIIKEKKYATFSNNLKYYMNLNKKTRRDLCNDLKLNYTTVREWCNGTAFPRYDKVEKLCDYFNITKSNLLDEVPNSLLTSGLRNNLELQNCIRNLAENKEQEELLLNCIMLNEEHTNILNQQASYYLDKENEENTK